LFNSLRADTVWHVRHSALFALPAILTRLKPDARRQLASNTLISLARDENSSVRSGVLEALGEVIYTFHDTPGSVPEDLLALFIGREGTELGGDNSDDAAKNVGSPAAATVSLPYLPIPRRRVSDKSIPPPPPLSPSTSMLLQDPSLDVFFSDPSRALICAFNMPAVALTLGKERWPALRELYGRLQRNRAVLVRRTLAASVGELARIVGPLFTRADLVGTWWDALHCEEDGDVRLKAVESTALLMEVLAEKEAVGAAAGNVQPLFLNSPSAVAQALVTVWEEGCLRGWRERECVLGLLELVAQKGNIVLMEKLLWKGLEDRVAAVREVAIKTVGDLSPFFSCACLFFFFALSLM
jgi:serine/threonine-protein phosphatase 4 regulatory subunit 1